MRWTIIFSYANAIKSPKVNSVEFENERRDIPPRKEVYNWRLASIIPSPPEGGTMNSADKWKRNMMDLSVTLAKAVLRERWLWR